MNGARYLARTCVYGVAFDERGRVLVVRYDGQLVLPGGCIEPGESEEQALVRGVTEETGYRIDVGASIGRAQQLVSREQQQTFRDNDCAFFRIDVTGAVMDGPTEPGRDPTWLTVEDAANELEYGSHRWAVAQAVGD